MIVLSCSGVRRTCGSFRHGFGKNRREQLHEPLSVIHKSSPLSLWFGRLVVWWFGAAEPITVQNTTPTWNHVESGVRHPGRLRIWNHISEWLIRMKLLRSVSKNRGITPELTCFLRAKRLKSRCKNLFDCGLGWKAIHCPSLLNQNLIKAFICHTHRMTVTDNTAMSHHTALFNVSICCC